MTDSGKEAPANDEGGRPGTTSGLPSAPSDLSIADMKQQVERIRAEYYIWRDAAISQDSVLQQEQLKALHEVQTAMAATKRAIEVLQQQKDILESAAAKVGVLNEFYRISMIQMQSLIEEKANKGAAEIEAITARIDEARKQVAADDDSSTGKNA